MDRTAVDGRGVPVNVALVRPGFRGWGLARPGVEAAIEKLGRAADPECGSMHGPPAARPILPLHRTAAARSSNGTGGPREPPADSNTPLSAVGIGARARDCVYRTPVQAAIPLLLHLPKSW